MMAKTMIHWVVPSAAYAADQGDAQALDPKVQQQAEGAYAYAQKALALASSTA